MKTLRKMRAEQETNAFIGLKKRSSDQLNYRSFNFSDNIVCILLFAKLWVCWHTFLTNEIVSVFGFHSLWNSLYFCWPKKFGSSRHKYTYTYTYFCQLIEIYQHFPKILTEKSEISWKRNKFNFETFSSKLLVSL